MGAFRCVLRRVCCILDVCAFRKACWKLWVFFLLCLCELGRECRCAIFECVRLRSNVCPVLARSKISGACTVVKSEIANRRARRLLHFRMGCVNDHGLQNCLRSSDAPQSRSVYICGTRSKTRCTVSARSANNASQGSMRGRHTHTLEEKCIKS